MSFIRSVALDSWTDDQIRRFSAGGNARLFSYFDKYGVNDFELSTKYKTIAADIYRRNLDHELAGEPLEPEPTYEEGRKQMSALRKTDDKMYSFGSDDLEPQNTKPSAIDSTLSAGKETLSKIGNFFEKSYKEITKKNPEEKRDRADIGPNGVREPRTEDANLGSKISDGMKVFGVS